MLKYPLNYTLLSFYLIDALDKNKHCSITDLHAAISKSELQAFLIELGINPDKSLITQQLQQEISNLIGGDIDHKLISKAQNGYALLLAYLIELIQRNKPNT